MKDFETYAARERLESLRANAARKLTRQQRAQRRRIYRRTSAVFLVLLLCLLSALCGNAFADASVMPQEPQDLTPMETPAELAGITHTRKDAEIRPIPEPEPEENENDLIEKALLEKATVIENCEVTWYTADTCGKKPGDKGYGITKSGLPVVENLTCAVDPNVIPLYSDVFVQYSDGTIQQFWATDTGVIGNAVDIYTPDYDYAIQCGRQKLTVWYVERDEANG